MAKKEAAPDMVEQFAEFKEIKNIDEETMKTVLVESFRKALENMFGADADFDVVLNPNTGDVQIVQNLQVVKVIPEYNVLMIKGSIPGSKGSIVLIEK